MIADLSRFKVIYGDRVLNAIALDGVAFDDSDTNVRPAKHMLVVAINEDGNIILIEDEAWRFQFVPIISR